MSKYYFTSHADQPTFAATAYYLLDGHWNAIQSSIVNPNPEALCAAYVEAIGKPFFERIAEIAMKNPTDKKAVLQQVAHEVLAHASFAEALYRWLDFRGIDGMFLEEHLKVIDAQVEQFKLSGDRETFFALMHVSLGDLCSASDRESTLGGGRIIEIPNPRGAALSMLEIVMPFYDRMQIQANEEPNFANRLHVAAENLVSGAESVLKLQTLIVEG